MFYLTTIWISVAIFLSGYIIFKVFAKKKTIELQFFKVILTLVLLLSPVINIFFSSMLFVVTIVAFITGDIEVGAPPKFLTKKVKL